MKPVATAALAAGALTLAAWASPAAAEDEKGASACFRTSDMGNHRVVDSSTLHVAVGVKDVWRIGMAGACLAGANSTDPLVIKTTGGTGLVCRPIDLDLAVSRGGGLASPCIVSSITKLTPEQVAALPPKHKP